MIIENWRNFASRRDALSVVTALFIVLFLSCGRNGQSIIGRWEVERVNVEFDESKATPEMVRQFGEMEKGNVIEISRDSLLTFIAEGDTLRGRCSLRGETLYLDGAVFGRIHDGVLMTETSTPLGKVEVFYVFNAPID